jgi:hypothetical protein
MCAGTKLPQKLLEECAAELTEAAFPVAANHGMHGYSVDLELQVWKAIEKALNKENLRPGRDEVLAHASDAIYRVALANGLDGPFLDLELELWHALRQSRPVSCAGNSQNQAKHERNHQVGFA